MSDEILAIERCPHLGLKRDPETWYAFPAKDNLCHKVRSAQRIPLGFQGQSCLTANHANCPIFQHEGRWQGSLPDEILATVGQAKEATRKWDTEWSTRIREDITREIRTQVDSDTGASDSQQPSPDDVLPGNEEDLPEPEEDEVLPEPEHQDEPDQSGDALESLGDVKLSESLDREESPLEAGEPALQEGSSETEVDWDIEGDTLDPEEMIAESPAEYDESTLLEGEEEAEEQPESSHDISTDIGPPHEAVEVPARSQRSLAPLLILLPLVLIVLGGIGYAVLTFTGIDLPLIGAPGTTETSTPSATESLPTANTLPAPESPTQTSIPPTPTVESPILPTEEPVTEETQEPTQPPIIEGDPFIAILSNDSNLRLGPGTAFEILDLLTAGTRMYILGRDAPGLWVLVRLEEDDREGWIVATQFIGDIGIEQIPIVPNPPIAPDPGS